MLSLLFSGTPGFDRVGGLARSSNPYWVGEDDEANYELLTVRDLVLRFYEIIRHVHEIESRDRFTFEKRSCHSRATFFVRRFKNVRRKEKSVELSRIITKKKKKKKKKRKTKGKSKRKKKVEARKGRKRNQKPNEISFNSNKQKQPLSFLLSFSLFLGGLVCVYRTRSAPIYHCTSVLCAMRTTSGHSGWWTTPSS